MVQQLGEFRESRAERRVRWICQSDPNPWVDVASTALAHIIGEDSARTWSPPTEAADIPTGGSSPASSTASPLGKFMRRFKRMIEMGD